MSVKVDFHFNLDWICSSPNYAGMSFQYVVAFYTGNSDNFKSLIEVEILPDNRGYNVTIGIEA